GPVGIHLRLLRLVVVERRFDIAFVGAVERIERRRVERDAQTQTRRRTHDHADLEIHAAAVEDRLLIEPRIVELRTDVFARTVHRRRRIARGIEIAVLLLIIDALLPVHALESERGAYVDDIAEVGP